jgi:hypothetical protein
MELKAERHASGTLFMLVPSLLSEVTSEVECLLSDTPAA